MNQRRCFGPGVGKLIVLNDGDFAVGATAGGKVPPTFVNRGRIAKRDPGLTNIQGRYFVGGRGKISGDGGGHPFALLIPPSFVQNTASSGNKTSAEDPQVASLLIPVTDANGAQATIKPLDGLSVGGAVSIPMQVPPPAWRPTSPTRPSSSCGTTRHCSAGTGRRPTPRRSTWATPTGPTTPTRTSLRARAGACREAPSPASTGWPAAWTATPWSWWSAPSTPAAGSHTEPGGPASCGLRGRGTGVSRSRRPPQGAPDDPQAPSRRPVPRCVGSPRGERDAAIPSGRPGGRRERVPGRPKGTRREQLARWFGQLVRRHEVVAAGRLPDWRPGTTPASRRVRTSSWTPPSL